MMGTPNTLVFLFLWSWPAIAVALFSMMPPRRALVLGYLIGWMFLPQFGFPVPFCKFDKHTATSVGALLGIFIFDRQRLAAFKPALVDLPMIVWCCVPFSAAVSNGLSPYDGLSNTCYQTMVWGVPYVLGRVYLGDFVGMRGLAVWLFVGGLIYGPFCLAEVAISPQLHFMLYGYYQHEFTQVIRMGGYRPMVFMQHGIAVGNYMMAASLMGIWLWWTGSLKTFMKMPVLIPLICLVGTTLAVKSAGALALLAAGLGVIFATKIMKNYLLVLVLCIVPFLYMGARSLAGWDGKELLNMIEAATEKDRAMSMLCRFQNEHLLLEKAMKKPLFGWGPNGRNLVTYDDGTIVSIPDGLWVIAIGVNGVIGLNALFLALLLPVGMLRKRIKGMKWDDPILAGVAAGAVLCTLAATDCLINAMINPIFTLTLGGIAGIVAAPAYAVRGTRTASFIGTNPGFSSPLPA